MDVAVAGVGHVDDPDAVPGGDLDDPPEDVGQSGPGHHAVLDAVAGTEPPHGPHRQLATLPEQFPLLGVGRLDDLAGVPLPAQRDDPLLLPVQPRAQPVDLDHHDGFRVQGKPKVESLLDGGHDPLVHQFHGRGDDALADDVADRARRVVQRLEDHPHRAVVLRIGRQPQPDSRHDGQCPLASHQQAEEVQPRGVGRRAHLDDGTVAQHGLQPQHVVSGHAVLEGVGPAGVGRHVAAQRAGPLAGRVRSEVVAGPGQGPPELHVQRPGLDHGKPVAEIDLEDLLHVREHDHHAPADRQAPACKAGPSPPCHHGHAVLRAEPEDAGDLIGRMGKDHRVRPVLFDREPVALVNDQVRRRGQDVVPPQVPPEILHQGKQVGSGHG